MIPEGTVLPSGFVPSPSAVGIQIGSRPLTNEERARLSALVPVARRTATWSWRLLALGCVGFGVLVLVLFLWVAPLGGTAVFLAACVGILAPGCLVIAGVGIRSSGEAQGEAIQGILARDVVWQVWGITVLPQFIGGRSHSDPVWKFGSWTLSPFDFTGNIPINGFEFTGTLPPPQLGGRGFLLTVNGRPVRQLNWSPSPDYLW